MLTVSEYNYKSDKITAEMNDFKIIQISDLHNKSFGKNQKYLIKKIKELNPDIIVITGDIVDSNHTNISKAMDFVNGAVEISPVYYVTGNHEHWLDDSEIQELISGLNGTGVKTLNNESVKVEKNGSSFVLSGLDDYHLEDDTLKNMKLDKNELNILLAHEPQYLTHYAMNNVDLVLSGHAHGGQFILPFIGGVIAPDQGFLPEYTNGKYMSADTTMIVSRGLGNSVIPVRLFNYPDIVCIT
ncbi:MAG: metallophosphoesterase, partial [Ruminococcus sp.]|nr:metallophosphoesterase [Ruminococcus sp.]